MLTAPAVRHAGRAPLLASARTAPAFNPGTAVGSWLAGLSLGTPFGATDPAVVGAAIAALALVPTFALAIDVRQRHRSVAPGPAGVRSAAPAGAEQA
ncbi:hypothetical protein [Streptomyces sp. NPDC055210]